MRTAMYQERDPRILYGSSHQADYGPSDRIVVLRLYVLDIDDETALCGRRTHLC